jgi:diguanylate cyclase (GGDEF)-like protein
MIDLDDFKNINDKHGHQKGDDILIRIAALFENTKRELDICSRYGGEEFVFVLPHTKINEAKKFAERIRISVQKTFEKNTSLTVSIGISNCPKSGITAKKLIKTADEALYESKRKGKNAITFK